MTSSLTMPSQSVLPHIVLFQPEIPANTGNVIRLCANCGAALHLIEPLGFRLDDKRLRRAGLDYHEYAEVKTWSSVAAYQAAHPDQRLVCVETTASRFHTDWTYQATDSLLFGPETRGLPSELLSADSTASVIRLPMLPGQRSLNLANSVAVVVYEAWRQHGHVHGV